MRDGLRLGLFLLLVIVGVGVLVAGVLLLPLLPFLLR